MQKIDLLFIYDRNKLNELFDDKFLQAFDFQLYRRGRVEEGRIGGKDVFLVLEVEDIDCEENPPATFLTEEVNEKIGQCLIDCYTFERNS